MPEKKNTATPSATGPLMLKATSLRSKYGSTASDGTRHSDECKRPPLAAAAGPSQDRQTQQNDEHVLAVLPEHAGMGSAPHQLGADHVG